MEGCHSLGTIYRKGRAGSIIEGRTDRGKDLRNEEEAEEHGLQLAKEWVDRRRSEV
jgi:hypothetical protein